MLYQPEIGQWFNEKFLMKYKLSKLALANSLNIHSNRISDLVNGRGKFSPNLDVLLCKYFNKPQGYFLKKQMEVDLTTSKEEMKNRLKKIIKHPLAK